MDAAYQLLLDTAHDRQQLLSAAAVGIVKQATTRD